MEKERIILIIITGILILSLLLNVFLYGKLSQLGGRTHGALIGNSFDYSDLNQTDKDISKSLISNLKLEYLAGTKEIIFKYDISEEAKKISEEEIGRYYPELVVGVNSGEKNLWKGSTIYIKFTGDVEQMEETICHELLHNFFYSDSFSHNIIEDIDDYKTCFKEAQSR